MHALNLFITVNKASQISLFSAVETKEVDFISTDRS